MHDALLVRGLERVGDLPRDRQRLVERDGATRDALRQVLALDELHHQSDGAAGVLEPVDAGDVRVIERREHFRFTLEARQPLAVAGDVGGQHLDGDFAFQLRIARAIHRAHSSFAEQRDDVVGAEARPGRDVQWRARL